MHHRVEIEFDEFGWEAVTEEARSQGVPVAELVVHAAMYYLADADPARFSHRVPRDPGELMTWQRWTAAPRTPETPLRPPLLESRGIRTLIISPGPLGSVLKGRLVGGDIGTCLTRLNSRSTSSVGRP